MQLFDTTQLGLEAALRATGARQQAIAQNIANVNTPGYRRVDVDFAGTLSAAMERGDRDGLHHFTPAVAPDGSAPVRFDGSSVDLDRETAAQAANGLQYEAIATVMRARLDILESAMGVR